MSPKLDSPRSIVAITNRLGYGRLGRRASRSLADLNALASYQQRSGFGYPKPRNYLLKNIASVDENHQTSSCDESEMDLYKPKMENIRIKLTEENEFRSYDKDISR